MQANPEAELHVIQAVASGRQRKGRGLQLRALAVAQLPDQLKQLICLLWHRFPPRDSERAGQGNDCWDVWSLRTLEKISELPHRKQTPIESGQQGNSGI